MQRLASNVAAVRRLLSPPSSTPSAGSSPPTSTSHTHLVRSPLLSTPIVFFIPSCASSRSALMLAPSTSQLTTLPSQCITHTYTLARPATNPKHLPFLPFGPLSPVSPRVPVGAADQSSRALMLNSGTFIIVSPRSLLSYSRHLNPKVIAELKDDSPSQSVPSRSTSSRTSGLSRPSTLIPAHYLAGIGSPNPFVA